MDSRIPLPSHFDLSSSSTTISTIVAATPGLTTSLASARDHFRLFWPSGFGRKEMAIAALCTTVACLCCGTIRNLCSEKRTKTAGGRRQAGGVTEARPESDEGANPGCDRHSTSSGESYSNALSFVAGSVWASFPHVMVEMFVCSAEI